MKHMVSAALVAGAVTLFGPHDLAEAGDMLTRAGVLIARLGLWLQPRGYDAGWEDPGDASPHQEKA